jgi:hypothetical protein
MDADRSFEIEEQLVRHTIYRMSSLARHPKCSGDGVESGRETVYTPESARRRDEWTPTAFPCRSRLIDRPRDPIPDITQ